MQEKLLESSEIGDLKSTRESISHRESISYQKAISHKAKVIDAFGNTPLILAAAKGNVQGVNDLLKGKVYVNAQNKYKRNAIFAAAVCGGRDGSLLLYQNSWALAVTQIAQILRNTPLILAAKNGDYPSVAVLF